MQMGVLCYVLLGAQVAKFGPNRMSASLQTEHEK